MIELFNILKSNIKTLRIQSDYIPYHKGEYITEFIEEITKYKDIYNSESFIVSCYESPFYEVLVNAFDIEIDLPKTIYYELYDKYKDIIDDYDKRNITLLNTTPIRISRVRR